MGILKPFLSVVNIFAKCVMQWWLAMLGCLILCNLTYPGTSSVMKPLRDDDKKAKTGRQKLQQN